MRTRSRPGAGSRLTAVAAGAALVVLVPATANAVVTAEWRMDEGAGATTMVDSAGGDDNGTITSVATGVPGLKGGKAYEFDGATSWVSVPDSDDLDPGSADITLSATVLVEDGVILDDSYEVVRKGVVSTKGGDWKMEIKRAGSNTTVGKLHCVFKGVLPNGSNSLAGKMANVDIVDGRPHDLLCIKTSTQVIARVVTAGVTRSYTLTKTAGSIANNQPVIIGSKVAGDDVMQGVIDQVSVDIG